MPGATGGSGSCFVDVIAVVAAAVVVGLVLSFFLKLVVFAAAVVLAVGVSIVGVCCQSVLHDTGASVNR